MRNSNDNNNNNNSNEQIYKLLTAKAISSTYFIAGLFVFKFYFL